MPEGAPPAPREETRTDGDWGSYRDKQGFLFAEFAFRKAQLSATNIDELLKIWSIKGDNLPFVNHKDMYASIDATDVGNVLWKRFSCRYRGEIDEDSPSWKKKEYYVHYRDPLAVVKEMLANTTFDGQMDYAPYLEYSSRGHRSFCDFMSGNWAYNLAVSTLF